MRSFFLLTLIFAPLGASACAPADSLSRQVDRFAVEVFDANSDGQVSRVEFARCESQLPAADILLTPGGALFDRLDVDGSGSLDDAELGQLGALIRDDIALDVDEL